VYNHLAQIVDAPFKIIHPGAGALQAIGGTDIEHQEAIHEFNQRGVIQIAGEQIRMTRLHTAVSADIQVPALIGGDHTNVFPLRFGTLAGTAGDRHFDFVRGAQSLVAVLQRDGQTG